MQYRKKRSRKTAAVFCILCALLSIAGALIPITGGENIATPITAALSALFFAILALVSGRYISADMIYSITDDKRFEIHILSGGRAVKVFSAWLSEGICIVKMSDFKKEKKKKIKEK